MEVKINREIRNYTESMFFGLSLRQFIFSVLACAVAVGLYFLLKPYLGTETVSWVCILGAAPFAALGFVKYNGMTAEKFIWAWIKSEFLMPKKLVFHSTNTYYELMKSTIEQKQKIKNETFTDALKHCKFNTASRTLFVCVHSLNYLCGGVSVGGFHIIFNQNPFNSVSSSRLGYTDAFTGS